MIKFYYRGKFKENNFSRINNIPLIYLWILDYKFSQQKLNKFNFCNLNWGQYTPYIKVMIIRGIGYRVFYLENDYALLQNELLTELYSTTTFSSIFRLKNNEIQTDNIEILDEDPQYWTNYNNEFYNTRYLVVRAGHTNDLFLALQPDIYIKTAKKDRKVIIYGINKEHVNNLARFIYNYRKPSTYTGRGVRRKHLKPIKKAGKKDKQKGRIF